MTIRSYSARPGTSDDGYRQCAAACRVAAAVPAACDAPLVCAPWPPVRPLAELVLPRCSSARTGARPAASREKAARSDLNSDPDTVPKPAPPPPAGLAWGKVVPAAGRTTRHSQTLPVALASGASTAH